MRLLVLVCLLGVAVGCSPVSPTVVQANWCAQTVQGQVVLSAHAAPCPYDPIQDHKGAPEHP